MFGSSISSMIMNTEAYFFFQILLLEQLIHTENINSNCHCFPLSRTSEENDETEDVENFINTHKRCMSTWNNLKLSVIRKSQFRTYLHVIEDSVEEFV